MKKLKFLLFIALIIIIVISCKKDEELTVEPEEQIIYVSVQQRLTDGETPYEIYTSDNSFLDSLYGKDYAGGRILYFNISNGTGLVYELLGTISGYEDGWGCDDIPISGADGLVIGTGLQNTIDIVNDDCSSINTAAYLCYNLTRNGYNDWFLPSRDELRKLKEIKNSGKYWSSSEYDASNAYYVDCYPAAGGGAYLNTYKSSITPKVCAVREFQ